MEDNNKDKIIYVPVDDILPNRFQPRLAFDEKELNELANSILKYGVIQPIVLRQIGDKYEIIAGERRYKASCIAGLKKVPAIINNTDDNTSAEIALLENLQRKNLSVIEEAQSYKKLLDKGFTQDDIAQKLGVSQSSIANKIRLLNLPVRVQDALLYNQISERHARSLLALNNEDLQISLLNRITREKLTVKQTEDEIAMILGRNNNIPSTTPSLNMFVNPNYVDEPKTEPIPETVTENKEIEHLDFIDTHVKEYNLNEEQKTLLEPQKIEEPKVDESFEPIEVVQLEVPEIQELDLQPKLEETKVIESYSDNNELNPFQDGNMSYVEPAANNEPEVISEPDGFVEQVLEEEKPEETTVTPFVQKEEVEENNYRDSLVNEYGEVNLPNVINKVRDFVGSLDEVSSLIETSELDLNDKYQIIIEIDKNTPM